ncbi:hypothetical protein G4H71_00080 [Rhodococcus triatomae]|uniref:Uncharacterized protein n=1 Tax=Rhodococcus triatomae TaxID=300028 RepID=A0A1G8CGB4_9NOCA|nr:hypothetical protein [Rhodococcus triatomae]QNG18660.1 hypothetical protein G4H72_07970 [Rhodococcus triatomae]QNG21670.1 hypothetical protein G4H71_00080 [Rhodococcus triatomae]SDH44452.1 hypothetical protein SAMN05444695_10216 [Rhodococcus triatomae]
MDPSIARDALSALTDAEIVAVVREVADARPGLAFLAAACADPGGEVLRPVEAFPILDAEADTSGVASSPASGTGFSGTGLSGGDVTRSDYTDDGVPTYDAVREKIEGRFGTAIGSAELAHETPAGKSVEQQWTEREKAAKARLDEIRKSMGTFGDD